MRANVLVLKSKEGLTNTESVGNIILNANLPRSSCNKRSSKTVDTTQCPLCLQQAAVFREEAVKPH